jgi:uncharacterized protein YqhQ
MYQVLFFLSEQKVGVMKKTSIGGEALIEGIMMRGPKSSAAAYRQSDGSIIVEKDSYLPLGKRYKVLGWPLIRGVVSLIESLVIGMKALMHSADMIEFETDETSKFDKFLEKIFGEKLKEAAIYFALVMALGLGILIFMIFPNLAASLIRLIGVRSQLLLNISEGVIRLLTFIGYILLVSKLKDIRRVFEYHGAEHKTIHAYENGMELTIENIKKFPTKHPRCGTAFMFLVILVSIVVFSFIGWHSVLINILFRILLIPLVAGISYEILKFAGKSDSRIMKIISWPGMMIQKFTTREPDDQQIEIAIAALKNVLDDIKEGEDVIS